MDVGRELCNKIALDACTAYSGLLNIVVTEDEE